MPILGVDGKLIARKSKRVLRKITKKPKAKKLRPKKKARQAKLPIREDNPVRNYQAYALQLQGGMYYVGITARADVTKRFNQHASGKGSKWTRLYPPISIIETRQLGLMPLSEAAKLEDTMTLEYMDRYGDFKVRGGGFCQVEERYLRSYLARARANRHPVRFKEDA